MAVSTSRYGFWTYLPGWKRGLKGLVDFKHKRRAEVTGELTLPDNGCASDEQFRLELKLRCEQPGLVMVKQVRVGAMCLDYGGWAGTTQNTWADGPTQVFPCNPPIIIGEDEVDVGKWLPCGLERKWINGLPASFQGYCNKVETFIEVTITLAPVERPEKENSELRVSGRIQVRPPQSSQDKIKSASYGEKVIPQFGNITPLKV